MISVNEHQYNARPTWKSDPRSNLTPGERVAIKELRTNENIVIKPADKGSAVIILNRLDYLKEGYKQLSEPRFYKKVDSCLTEKHRKEVQDTIEDMYQDGEIDDTVKSYLTDSTCRTPQLYLLPKIHKKQ
jgi:hypothetical protein